MSNMPYFKFYHQDWLSGTAELSLAERGAYITLVAIMYDHGGKIVRDDGRLAKRCGTTTTNFRKILNGLIATGKVIEEDGFLTSKRVNEECSAYLHTSKMQSDKARSRWDKVEQNQSSENATVSDRQCQKDACQKSEVRSQKDIDKSISISLVNSPSALPAPSETGESEIKVNRNKNSEADKELMLFAGETWNDLADKFRLPQVSKLTDKRKSMVLARAKELVKDYDFENPADGFQALFDKIKKSRFLRGEVNNFRCDFDFAFEQSSFTKIMEGKYEN